MAGPSAPSKKMPQKKARIRLTKEQKEYVNNLVQLENRISVCREYIQLWMAYFRFIAALDEDKEITPAEEKAFFQTMTQLAGKQFMFVELMGDTFDAGKDIMNVTSKTISLSSLKMMEQNSLERIELEWHNTFLSMNKALGRLLRLVPSTKPLTELLASLNARPVATPGAEVADGKKK